MEVPNAPPNFCFTLHVSQLKRYVLNDQELFPERDFPRNGLVVLADGWEEHVIEWIVDERQCGVRSRKSQAVLGGMRVGC